MGTVCYCGVEDCYAMESVGSLGKGSLKCERCVMVKGCGVKQVIVEGRIREKWGVRFDAACSVC